MQTVEIQTQARMMFESQGPRAIVEASRKAKSWALWSALSGPILIVIWFLFFGGLAMLGALFGNH